MWTVIFGVPSLLVKLNPPPNEVELMHFRAKILYVSERPPNLIVATADGEHRGLRFPTPLYMLFSGKTSFLGLSTEQKTNLFGCDAEIYGSNVRYLWPASFRIWKIDCAEAPISYRQITEKYNSMNVDYGSAPWFGLLVMSVFLVVEFVQMRKRK